MKIRRFIDKTKRRTRMMNRERKRSEPIYVEEKNITFAEISRTIDENSVPQGSIIRVI